MKQMGANEEMWLDHEFAANCRKVRDNLHLTYLKMLFTAENNAI